MRIERTWCFPGLCTLPREDALHAVRQLGNFLDGNPIPPDAAMLLSLDTVATDGDPLT